jgi:FkbM family methyltransferase
MLGKALRRAELAYRARRYRKRVDPDEIRWMLTVLRPGDLAVDVGAHKGGYLHLMRGAVGEAGAVVAFEPQPELAAYLREVVRDFGWQNVVVRESALSSASGRRVLWRPGDAPSPAASLDGRSLPPEPSGGEVEVETLDAALTRLHPHRPVRLIKCDAEGHELEVLAGARAVLAGQAPFLLVECEARHTSRGAVEDVFARLSGLGYRGTFYWRGERLDVSRFDPALHQVGRRRPYANNFIFEPEAGA